MSGYNFVAYGAMGDQPGQHAWHYLAPWQTLPDGAFIALQKFAGTNTITDPITFTHIPHCPISLHQQLSISHRNGRHRCLARPTLPSIILGQLVSGSGCVRQL